jgi:hypothetical protein
MKKLVKPENLFLYRTHTTCKYGAFSIDPFTSKVIEALNETGDWHVIMLKICNLNISDSNLEHVRNILADVIKSTINVWGHDNKNII